MFAVSYDPVSVLDEFGSRHGIGYPLLSDVGSRVIEEIGVLDDKIAEHHAYFGGEVKEKHRGLPYTGTFFLDGDGVVVGKDIRDSYRDRSSGAMVLGQVGGVSRDRAYSAEVADFGLTARAWVSSAGYHPLQRSLVHIELDFGPGLHAYVEPVPTGYTPLRVEIVPDPLVAELPWTMPAGEPFTVDGLDEDFFVVGGHTRISIPFAISGSRHHSDGRNREEPLSVSVVNVTLELEYQVCSDTECFPPGIKYLSIPLRELPLLTD